MAKSIEGVKQTIYNAIEEERKRVEAKLAEDKLRIEKVSTVPEALTELVEIYGNNLEQRKLMTSILKDHLRGEFFKGAEVKGGANYVHFKNGNYSVGFSTSRFHSIVISRDETVEIPVHPSGKPLFVQDDVLEFYEIWENFRDTGEDFDKLLNVYSKMKRAIPSDFIFKLKTTMEDIYEFAKEQEEKINDVNRRKQIWQEELDEYNKEVELFTSIIEDIEIDLLEFRRGGWYITTKNLYTLESIVTESIERLKMVEKFKESELV